MVDYSDSKGFQNHELLGSLILLQMPSSNPVKTNTEVRTRAQMRTKQV